MMTFIKNIKGSVATLALLSTSLLTVPALADQVFLDDVIVEGSLCVGIDCVNGESFGFDTIRLKENNLRIHFDDTSASASFPANDWRILINDSTNGGASYFAIEDSTGGRRPFGIVAGAPEASLTVANSGNIGVGTESPVVEVHVKDGNTPTLRLEQDGSSGFTPQTYDLASNEANFFIRDVTNGSRLFFRAKPGAPEDSLFIAANGDIGLGTDAPTDPLDVRGDRIRIENTGAGASIQLNESGSTFPGGLLLSGDRLILAIDDGGNPELLLDANGNLTIQGTITTMGSCSIGCDAVFDEAYDLPTIEEHAEMMFDNKYLPVVGPTQTGPINLSDKLTGMLNELEKAHIYIAQVNAEKKQLQARLDAQEARLAKLEALIE